MIAQRVRGRYSRPVQNENGDLDRSQNFYGRRNRLRRPYHLSAGYNGIANSVSD